MTNWAALLWFIASMPTVVWADHWQADDPQYIAPLVGPYAIERLPKFPPESGAYVGKSCALVVPNYAPTSDPVLKVLPDVSRIGVARRFIVGLSGAFYFLFDTNKPIENIQCFASEDDLKGAMNAAGINAIELQDADAYAASMPDQATHPWNYVVMRGLLGKSDDDWSGIAMDAYFIGVFLVGITGRPKSFRLRLLLTVAFALAAVSLGSFIENYCDDPTFLAVIVYLPCYLGVALVGAVIRNVWLFVWRWRQRGFGQALAS